MLSLKTASYGLLSRTPSADSEKTAGPSKDSSLPLQVLYATTLSSLVHIDGVQCILQSSEVEYKITGFQTIFGTTRSEVQIDLENPLNDGTYVVQIYTIDKLSNQVIDRATHELVIQDICSSLSSHIC